jgi:hypothetical protein
MNQTYTKDYDEWNNRRSRTDRIDGGEQLPLSVPANLRTQFKGFAFGPVFLDDDGNAHECKTRVIPAGDSICNYDYSDCYLLDYHIVVSNHRVYRGEDGNNVGDIRDVPYNFDCVTGIRVRYSGQEKARDQEKATDETI